MSSSGIKTDVELMDTFKNMKTKKIKKKVLVCKIADQVVEDKEIDEAWDQYACENGEDWNSAKKFMTERFPEMAKDCCRYVFLDVPVKKKDTQANDKLKMISWHPMCCKIKDKMLLSSSKGNLKKSTDFGDISDTEADDESDLKETLDAWNA